MTMTSFDISCTYLYNHMIWELWETTMSSMLNILKVFGFGHYQMSQMSIPSAQLVQPVSLAAQVEANFSDAETSLQLAEVGVLSGGGFQRLG